MRNPYEVMYDARMDVYRRQEVTEGDFTKHEPELIASGRKCRYSSSGQVSKGEPNPSITNSHKLFCGLDEDIREGDHLVITLRTGKKVEVNLGECHPYTYQWQCEIKRDDNA